MKKILYIFIILFVLTTGMFSFGYVANAAPENAEETSESLAWYDTDPANGEYARYSVWYDSSPAQKLVKVMRNGRSWIPPRSPEIYRNTAREDEYLKDKIPGGGDAVRAAYASVKNRGVDYESQVKNAKAAGGQIECIVRRGYSIFPDFNWQGCAAMIFNQVVLRVAAIFLWVAAWFFNFTLSYSLNMGNFLQTVPIVDIGWKIFRDVANLCFIFILLYIAINTILQASVANTKKLLGTVIIVAVLLNFSLFFTKVVIDSSNILALQFYEKMGGEQTPSIASFINKNMKSGGDKGIAQTFMKGLGLSGIYNAGKSQEGADKEFQAGAWTTVGNVLAVSIGGAILITVTAFVFFAAAFMFLIRTVVLIFVMILAPLAFLSLALPKGAVIWSKWSGMLISQSFFAPIYMIFIYLVVAIITGEFGSGVDDLGGKMNIATFLTGNGSAVGTLYVFVVLIAMMLGSLFMAKNMGAVGGDLARSAAGKVTFGAGAWMGRQTAGRALQYASKSDLAGKMRNATGRYAPLRSIAGMVDKGAAGSFDIRGSALGAAAAGAVGGLGKAGGEGGMRKMQEDDKKRNAEYQKIVTQAGKKSELDAALKAGDDTQIQTALYKFSDNEYSELGGSLLTDERVIRNSKPSHIAAVTDEKFDKLRVDQKNKIRDIRNEGVTHSASDLNPTDKSGVQDIMDRYNSLSAEAKAKIRTNTTHGAAWAPVLAHMEAHPEDASAVQSMISALAPAERGTLLRSVKTANIKGELNKLSSEEKSKLDIGFLTDPANEDLLRNLDSDTIKAINDRKDIPPVEKDRIKTARQNLLENDLHTANVDGAKDLLKGAKAGELIRLISTVGTGNTTLAKLLTVGQVKELEEAEFEGAARSALGAAIRTAGGARAENYVRSPRGVAAGW